MDPTTIDAVGQAATAANAAATTTTTFDAGTLLRLLEQGGLTVYPLAIASIVALAIVIERFFRFRGLEAQVRDLTRRVVDHLAKRDLAAARALCEASSAKNPMASASPLTV